jgi:hypothetical protein
MNNPLLRNCFICALQFFSFSLFAQNKPAQNTLQPPPAGITVDGDLKEWGDSLRYYNEDKKIYYSLANTKDTLYMAIRINDRSEQTRILYAGLTFSIDPKGHKKEAFTVTFPFATVRPETVAAIEMRQDTGKLTDDTRDDERRAKLTKLSQVKVTGFKDVESEMITTSNTYGFKNALDYDKDGNMVYELAIPLALFHADDLYKNEWAFNFKINGITKPGSGHNDPNNDGLSQDGARGLGGGGMGGGRGGGMGGGRGGRGGGMRGNPGGQGSDRSELSRSVDFWGKFFLAK